jgi:hypothetical protein
VKCSKTRFLTWLIIGPRRPLRVESFPSAFSRTVGKDRKRRVCPVGAVSKTITEYSIDLTCLGTSSIRAGRSGATHLQKDRLHDFCKAHGLVDARDCKSKILHHAAHHAVRIGCTRRIVSKEDRCKSTSRTNRTLFNHLLDGTRRVDFHGKQVLESVDFGCILRKLLTKGIGKIVSWICRLSG